MWQYPCRIKFVQRSVTKLQAPPLTCSLAHSMSVPGLPKGKSQKRVEKRYAPSQDVFGSDTLPYDASCGECDGFGGAVEQQVDGNPHLHLTCSLAHSLSVFGRPKGKSQKGGVATARPDFVTETSRPDSPLSHPAISEDVLMASNNFPSWWRTPINEWPPHTFEWPPPPHIKTERLPSGWNCRCGRNDMSWRHQEPPHVDAMCFQCFTLMEADGIVMDEWCRSVRSTTVCMSVHF